MSCLRVESYKVSSHHIYSLCIQDINTATSKTRNEEGGVAIERVRLRVDKVPIVSLEGKNQNVPLQETSIYSEVQDYKVTPIPQDPLVEGYITNAELRAALKNLTQLMTTQVNVNNNHFVAQADQGVGP